MQDLITFLMLQIPVLLLGGQYFKSWSKAKTLAMHKMYGGKGYCGLPVKKCGITLYSLPLNENTMHFVYGAK